MGGKRKKSNILSILSGRSKKISDFRNRKVNHLHFSRYRTRRPKSREKSRERKKKKVAVSSSQALSDQCNVKANRSGIVYPLDDASSPAYH
ncbi:hypothetical protein CEXT_580261 [Caerostris extrusa]|uniref:Uncharacterized protein n=1 Tax=Caerostris extrusa TaxID=172846 RepID=A0AAV4SJL3_CAEEX|nr:hypothetical protein CEXT_580261 [Caerostris extrusa]